VGRSGSGKTLMVRALLGISARSIVGDPLFEYDENDGADPARSYVVYDLESAVETFLRVRREPFTLIFRHREPAEYLALLEVAEHSQRTEPLGPLVIATEEASRYSETHEIPDVLRKLYNAGRHYRISLLTVIQVDTDIHRVTRRNSQVIVSFAQNGQSADMRKYFRWDEIEALTPMDAPGEFQRYGEPVQGRHFAVYPPMHGDFYEWWQEQHGHIFTEGGEE